MKPSSCLALLALLATPAAAQDKDKPKVDQARVDAAIENGCKFLKTQVDTILRTPISMTWEPGSPGSRRHSMIPIAVLTLRHGGVDPNDDAFKRLFDAMMSMKIETTYTAALMAMALQKIDPVRYQSRIAECAQYLIDNQAKNGQWCYGHATDTSVPAPKEEVERGGGGRSIATRGRGKDEPPEEPKRICKYYLSRKSQSNCAHGDNSNSQYAALGLRAAVECNVVVPQETLTAAVGYWERAQRPDGGWDYGVPANVNDQFSQRISYGSMTIGGYSAVAIYKYLLRADHKRDPRVQAAGAWIAKNWTVDANPANPKYYHYYYLYGIERGGDLVGNDRFGPHDWYFEGATWLLSKQNSNGSWKGNLPSEEIETVATCFAVLFLKRATVPLIKTEGSEKK
jgi:hypothetical protein